MDISQIISPDLFTRLCKAILAAELKDFQTIDDSGGDAGNDGYSSSQETLFAFYCPEKPQKAADSTYKDKIKKDLYKAKKLLDSKKYKIKDWIFITPCELREPVQTFLRFEAKARGMNGIAWASHKLTDLFTKHSNLRSQFPELIQPDVERQIIGVLKHLEAVDDVKKEYRTKLEQSYQRRIDQAKQKLDQGKYETAKKEYELILSDLNLETEKIDSHIYFRALNDLGVCEFNLGDPETAAESFEKAYKVEPGSPMAICKHALSKLLKGVPAEGLSIIEELLHEHPADDQAISIKANILYALGKYPALDLFLKEKGKIILAHWYKGHEQMLQKHYEAALSSFENVIQLEPENVRALLLIAQNIMVGMKEVAKNNPFPSDKAPGEITSKFNRAIACLKEAIRLLNHMEQKEDLEMAYANLSGCYIAVGSYKEAIDAAEKAIAIDPESAVSFLNKGISQLKLGYYQDAIKSLQAYKDLGGTEIDADRHIAFCALEIGDLPKADKIISDLLGNESQFDIDVAELATELYSRKLDAEKLKNLFEKLEREFPKNSQALRLRGKYMQKLGIDGAGDLLQQALENAISEAEKTFAEIDLADFRYDREDYTGAAELYKKYLDLKEGNPMVSRYARCLYNSGQYGILLDWLDTLDPKVRQRPIFEQVEAYTNLYLGNLNKASQLFKDLSEKNPDNLQYLVYYGMCRFQLGKESDAKVAFDAVKNRLKETQDLIILAGGYEFIGEWETAISLTYKALEHDPNNPKAHLAFIFTFLKREQADSKEPDEKYIKKFQKSIGEFNKRFPEEKALQGFEVKNGDISPILKIIDQASKTSNDVADLYRQSRIPMASVPRLTGKKPFDIWAAFTQMPEVGIKISFGSSDEIKTEASTIEECQGKAIVVDIYPLFLLAYFDQLVLLSQLFKKIYIHQSIMDELTGTADEQKMSVRKGLEVLGKVDGKYQMTKVSSEQVQKALELIERIRTFISTDPNVEICGLSKEKQKGERNIVNALDASTGDSVLLAQELEVPFYCDDRILRAMVNRDLKVKSFSSQTLFIIAHKSSIITLDKRYELQEGMIEFNYGFISVDATFIFTQLKNNGYRIESIQKIVSSIAGKETAIQSLGVVLADLFFLLMGDKSITGLAKLAIFKNILEQISLNHNLASIEEVVFVNLQHRFKPEKLEQLRRIIRIIFQSVSGR